MEGEMMMDEMAPMMAVEEQEKPMEEVDEDGISIAREHELTPCCCCLCACSNEYTPDPHAADASQSSAASLLSELSPFSLPSIWSP